MLSQTVEQPKFKGGKFDPFMKEAGANAFTITYFFDLYG